MQTQRLIFVASPKGYLGMSLTYWDAYIYTHTLNQEKQRNGRKWGQSLDQEKNVYLMKYFGADCLAWKEEEEKN